jgi:hypothetical protein
MYECEVIEVCDFEFNHYIHHIDEFEGDIYDDKSEFELIYDMTEYYAKFDA